MNSEHYMTINGWLQTDEQAMLKDISNAYLGWTNNDKKEEIKQLFLTMHETLNELKKVMVDLI